MGKMNGWPLMIFLLSFILGCIPTKGLQEAREKADKELKMILENLDGYAQKAEAAARRSERACFCFMRELVQKAATASQNVVKGSEEAKWIGKAGDITKPLTAL